MVRVLTVVLMAALLASTASAQLMRDHDQEGGVRGFHGLRPVGGIKRSFQSDAEARAEFERIVAAVGLGWIADRIQLRASAETPNAEAGIGKNGERFIFYNALFMQKVKQKTAEHWSLVSILAHEIGHHLAFHTEIEGRWHEFELEADYFSGFVLARLGATLDQAHTAMRLISPKEASPTHPGLDQRLQVITIGWTDAGAGGAPRGLKRLPPAQTKAEEEAQIKAALLQKQLEEEKKQAEPKRKADEAAARDPALSVKPGSGESFRDCDVCPEMVVVPAGSFTIGSPASEPGRTPAEGPQGTVILARPFAVGRFEVTFAEWDACVAAGACSHGPGDQGWGRGKRPVINVSWNDITQQYLPWLSRKTGKTYRLLSEAEWEYAARAGTTTPFWWGPSISTDQANYDGNYTYGGGSKGEYRQKTVPVDSFAKNPWGLYNVHGNVWEWMQDCRNGNYNGAPSDGSARTTGDCGRRVLRGGSSKIGPDGLRSAVRVFGTPDLRYDDLGFRVGRMI